MEELKAFLCSFGESLTEDEVERVVKRYDVDKNGKMNYTEFINMLLRA
jgi:Ca2+-binding EF-hand superfamily protein